jgi:hypothetical protein
MAADRVADLTMRELREVIRDVINEHLKTWPRPGDPRTTQEVLDSIDRNMWTPPEGSPSTLQFLREDRDR